MAPFDLRTVMPDPMTPYTCPCGYRGPYKSVISHRRGYKRRPDCAQGNIRPLTEAELNPVMPALEPTSEESLADFGGTAAFDSDGPSIADAEELARQLRNSRVDSSMAAAPAPLLGDGGGWRIEPPVVEGQISQDRIGVLVPLKIRVIYDWMTSQGWHVGDSSFSTFVADSLMDYFVNVVGIDVGVFSTKEIAVGE